jgi:murein DD-endopeptidase MepM/ murein hydrolase activator NlpD
MNFLTSEESLLADVRSEVTEVKTIYCVIWTGALLALLSSTSRAQQPIFKLPFAPLSSGHLCTQGVFGTTSHDRGNILTQFDLDFDTPNSGAAQEVLAAADGIAFGFGGCALFDIGCNHGFGNHVKIDHGSGIFTIYAHLETVRAKITGSRVRQGNVIGTEGATGQAINPTTGLRADHIHFGLHSGDPTGNSPGSSILIERLEVIDQTANSGVMTLRGDQIVCGLDTGHVYNSTNIRTTRLGDLNRDGVVNSLDWSIMNSKWLTNDAIADLNNDGIVNSIDFSIMNSNWLQ